jgi:hypothetical protein
MATAEAAHGGIAVWGDTRLTATLSFICRRERELEPGIGALRDVVRDVFSPAAGSGNVGAAAQSNRPTSNRGEIA